MGSIHVLASNEGRELNIVVMCMCTCYGSRMGNLQYRNSRNAGSSCAVKKMAAVAEEEEEDNGVSVVVGDIVMNCTDEKL